MKARDRIAVASLIVGYILSLRADSGTALSAIEE
jgi:hypothetical protein